MSTHTDPMTGDTLTTGEWISWKVQHVMRRWAFLGVIVLLTVACWLMNDTVRTWWNYAASLAALLIEGITAMALINQTLRDAHVSRETRATSQRTERMERAHGDMLRTITHQQLAVLMLLAAVGIAALFRLRRR